ncbi:Uncharacterised protein [Bordetella pertussis]|nr:Uncharacterised protein [Bordetella pertussis]CFO79182.1 Uncharacterised protein [Bordetella pertussis]CFU02520.1 Uncharacterised protein [Bordetella pertussis]CFU91055.1 Uncharacterised protein [Bordetella pertussis]CFW39226.1 Uncharacterised protein [Bordetella pertussis]
MAYMSYDSPLEVELPWNFLPYQEARPCWRNGRSLVSGT